MAKKTVVQTKEELEVTSIYKEYNKKHSTLKKVVLFLIVGLYIFFFLSPMMFHEPATVYYTPPGTWESLDEYRNFNIISWTYSPSQAMMEVQLEIDNLALTGDEFYDYDAFVNFAESNKEIEPVPISVMYESIDLAVIWIGNIPANFNSCNLNVFLKEDHDTYLQLFTESSSVEKVDIIEQKSSEEYRIERINVMIDEVQQLIDDNNEKIQENNEQIQIIEQRIPVIEEKIKYQTYEEAEHTKSIIENYKDDIVTLQATNNSLADENEQHELTIQEYQSLIDNIRTVEN